MAALDDSVLDEMTGRPAKVLVCKEHVPMPKTSFGTDTLAFKHMTSAPKPSMSGLHRSLMGDRASAALSSSSSSSSSTTGQKQQNVSSPRSLAQGSHAQFLKNMNGASKVDAEEEEEGGESKSNKRDEQQQNAKEKENEEPSSSSSTTTTTLPKYQRGRFTISDSDSIAVAHASAEAAQDPKKDDDSFRNLPVRHEDYGHKEGHTAAEDKEEATKNAKDDAEDWDQAEDKGEEEEEDHKQERVFTMKGSGGESSANKSNGGSSFMNKLQKSLDKQPQHPSTTQQQQHGRGGDEIVVALETPVDISDRVQRDHLKIDLENDQEIEAAEIKAPPGEAEEKKLVDMAFSSKLMQQKQQQKRNKKKNSKKNDSPTAADKAVEDDEWGTDVTSTTDSLGRREPVAGM
ncbi:hypothetical protein BGZ75_004548 [Mortierella antarctica]|nr:hypothetical protein BGZ75_004548 [Mortierella antarctica]